ncbi:hypothetical protein FGG79_11790 [Bacillus sp. BHET2]|uniref:hypothetical protein n=1 Tax=Bacillus sp. BHET2 TaxID=2583818 RepID=UPI00110DBCB6|nr:hypothetical protein [Bacillus sp. BHET2]TMU85871.1 hypothetical protein FGG79_11790 [Bacillus sp. BHET2]
MSSTIEELYKKYVRLAIPNQYKIKEAETILMKEYSAVFYPIKEVAFLLSPEEEKILDTCFKIEDPGVLFKLFTEQEKKDLKELKEINKQNPLNLEIATKSEVEYTRIQEGNYVMVFFGTDHEGKIQEVKLLGYSQKMFDLMTVFIGVDHNQCLLENRDFQEYLLSLSNLGYLD